MDIRHTQTPITAFIPAALDDAGLTTNEFRVYCAILRRGDCFESVPKIADRCRMHRDTAWAALKSLEARGAITKISRRGHTTLFTALPVTLWAQPSGIGGVAENKGYPSKPGETQPLISATPQPEIRVIHPAESEGYKGSPIEGNPIKFLPAKEAESKRPELEEVLAESKKIGLAEWRATEWFNEMEGCGWTRCSPVIAWRNVLDFIRLKWDLDGRRENPGSNRSATGNKPRLKRKVKQPSTTQVKQTASKRLANL